MGAELRRRRALRPGHALLGSNAWSVYVVQLLVPPTPYPYAGRPVYIALNTSTF